MNEPRVDVRPDPRISNQRPGWLSDDTQWRDQLQAMDLDDVRWIERHWEDAGGPGPAVDMSWITYETGGSWWGLLPLVGAVVVVAAILTWVLLEWAAG